MDSELPNRQSIRMKGWDYTSAGCYFVTINTHGNRALFGVIVNGRMVLNEAGRVAEKCWREIPAHFPMMDLDEFVIMPNHLHGVLHLRGKGHGMPSPCFGKPQAGSLGTVVGAFKAAVSRIIGRGRQLPTRAKEPIAAGASAIWHRNYWDVIVQDEKALAAIRNYIRFNPQNYEAVFKSGLEHQRPMIWVKPSGLARQALPHQALAALDAGRLLIVSPFAEELEAPSIRRAAWCNQYVLAHCNRMVVGYLNPGGMLACILSESDPDMEIVYL